MSYTVPLPPCILFTKAEGKVSQKGLTDHLSEIIYKMQLPYLKRAFSS